MSQASTTKHLSKIAVLVSVGRHPVSGTARYSRNDAAALTLATRLAAQHQATLDVLHAGDSTNPALREYLALGAAKVEVLAVAAGDEIAPALAARLKGYDLVLTGTRAEGTEDSGMLPYQLADALGVALLASAVDVDIEAGVDATQVTVRQFLPKGLRRRVQASLPAAGRGASHGQRHAAIRIRETARRRDRTGAGERRQRGGRSALVDQARDGKTRAAGGGRKAFGPCAHALGHDHGKPRRQRRN